MTTPTNTEIVDGVRYRPGMLADMRAANAVAERSFDDLARRNGWGDGEPIDEAGLERELEAQRTLYQHLTETAERFWVAESGGRMVGVARSTLRDGLRQLTELFVLPEAQSTGIGRELLERTFPSDGADVLCILATPDLAALAMYLKVGVSIRFPNYGFSRPPETTSVPTDLAFEPIDAGDDEPEAIGRIDRKVLGYRRDVDHRWLRADRTGFLYKRDGQAVGYGYVGEKSGPFALLDPADFPAVLAHAESLVAADGHERFSVVVPMVNESAVSYLLSRGFRLDPFFSYLMSDRPFGRFDRYIETTPTFFL
jgi:GNAT superfamily N-acetyltransferase